jgi:hypothetical protein
LGELKSYTENPKTLARLRGASIKSGELREKLRADLLEAVLLSRNN